MDHVQFAPPPGPPPGWRGHHQQHSGSHPPPPANQYQQNITYPNHTTPQYQPPPGGPYNYNNAPPRQQYYPPPGSHPPQHHYGHPQHPPPQQQQQQQQHHYPPQRPGSNSGYSQGYNNYGAAPPQSAPPARGGPFPAGFTKLPPKFWMRVRYGSSGETYIELCDEPKGDAVYSAKMGMSGRMKFKIGKYKHAGDTVIGEANNKGFMGSKAAITYNGRDYEMSKSHVGLTSQVWSFNAPGAGGRAEDWQWVAADTSLSAKLTSQKGWKLVRKGAPEDAPGVVVFKHDTSMSMSTERLGTVEFVGQGLTGELGDVLPNVAVMSLTKMKAIEVEKKIMKAVSGGA